MRESRLRHPVRPRWVWAAVLLALIGVVVLGVGVGALSWWWSTIGAVMLALGAIVFVGCGGLYAAQVSEPMKHEKSGVMAGGVEEGIGPQDRMEDEGARRRAAEVTRRKRMLLDATASAPRPPFNRLCVLVLLAVAAALLAGQWLMPYPFTVPGRDSALRDQGFAVALGLAASWWRQVGPGVLVTLVCSAVGAALVFTGLFVGSGSAWIQSYEIALGCTVLASVGLAGGWKGRGQSSHSVPKGD